MADDKLQRWAADRMSNNDTHVAARQRSTGAVAKADGTYEKVRAAYGEMVDAHKAAFKEDTDSAHEKAEASWEKYRKLEGAHEKASGRATGLIAKERRAHTARADDEQALSPDAAEKAAEHERASASEGVARAANTEAAKHETRAANINALDVSEAQRDGDKVAMDHHTNMAALASRMDRVASSHAQMHEDNASAARVALGQFRGGGVGAWARARMDGPGQQHGPDGKFLPKG